tara:strand:- start:62098 stop:62208 length:111 start_codon:yes stop_codon:yes gene_type:complete
MESLNIRGIKSMFWNSIILKDYQRFSIFFDFKAPLF